MECSEASFVSSRGVRLHTRTWKPIDRTPTSVVFFLHGFGDYLHGTDEDCPTGTYHARAKCLGDWGAACVGIEHQGHGRSEGNRVYIRHIDDLVSDASDFLHQVVCKNWPSLPVFLFGESMGGAISIILSLREDLPAQVKGMVLFAPMVTIHPSLIPPKPVVKMLRFIAKKKPKAKIVPGDSKKLAEKCVRDKALLKRIMEDELIYKGTQRVGTAVAMLDTTLYIGDHMEAVKIPVLILHGEADTVTEPEFSRQFYERAGSSDKTLKVYKDVWHAIMSEKEWQDMALTDIFAWLETHL